MVLIQNAVTCSANGSVGKCEAAATAAAPGASQANTRRFKRRMNDSTIHARQVRSSDLRAGRLAARKHL